MMFGRFFFFKQKTAYEIRISDWSSDVCSSDLVERRQIVEFQIAIRAPDDAAAAIIFGADAGSDPLVGNAAVEFYEMAVDAAAIARARAVQQVEFGDAVDDRSEENTSEFPTLMRISYAIFCSE